MIDMKPVASGATLLDKDTQLNPNLTQQYSEIVGRLLPKDLEFIEGVTEGNTECACKDEQVLEEEDIANMDTAPLELDEMPDMQEELTPLPASPVRETSSILTLPAMGVEDITPTRRVSMRRRRSEDQEEHPVNTADAGESDAVMTYLREIGRVPMITHEREIELAPREPAKSIARHIALNAGNGRDEGGLVQPHSTWTRGDMVESRTIASIKKERLAGDDVGPLPEV